MSNNPEASSVKECPLCCNPLKDQELDWYPCPCGYQVCAFCFERLKQTPSLNKCASCQRPFDPDAAQRIGPQFKPAINPTFHATTVSYYLATKIVQVIGIPDNLFSPQILMQDEYFGQYGPIDKMSVDSTQTAPSAKTVLSTTNINDPSHPLKSVFVKFKNDADATACILAFEGHPQIQCSRSVVELCPKASNGRSCNKANCLKRHRQCRQSDLSIPTHDIDSKDSDLRNRINPVKPYNYSLFPKKAHLLPIFPAPRLIPATYFPFSYSQIYEMNAPNLLDLVMERGSIPPPSSPGIPIETERAPLASTLSLPYRLII